MAMIRRFGCVIAVTVTSTRKALSIMLSFVMYPKPFSISYLFAFMVFSCGLATDVVAKNPGAKQAAIKLIAALESAIEKRRFQPILDYFGADAVSEKIAKRGGGDKDVERGVAGDDDDETTLLFEKEGLEGIMLTEKGGKDKGKGAIVNGLKL